MKSSTLIRLLHLLVAALLALMPSGCEKKAETASAPAKAPSAGTAEQGQSPSDHRITTDIRKSIVDDGTLSINAHNCKIITKDGVVTLRGPVASMAERDIIDARARATAGVRDVVNELEITT